MNMPPSGFDRNAVLGALAFAKALYESLLAEVRSGKYSSFEAAIEAELAKIEHALERAHLTPEGELVTR